jgi:hypothetical protein
MPYITMEDRARFAATEIEISNTPPTTAGELQYLIAVMIGEYLLNTDYRYQNMNDVMGALSGAQQEFYRRHVGPYEDKCIRKNGDVYVNSVIQASQFEAGFAELDKKEY